MSKSKKWLSVSVLFIMLVVLGTMPLFLTNFHNNKLIGSINIVPLNTDSAAANANTSENYNVRDRLRVISGKVVTEYANVPDSKVSADTAYSNTTVINEMEEQLAMKLLTPDRISEPPLSLNQLHQKNLNDTTMMPLRNKYETLIL